MGQPFIVGTDGTAIECVYWMIMTQLAAQSKELTTTQEELRVAEEVNTELNLKLHKEWTKAEAQSKEMESLREDAQRYRFLRPLYACIDFDYGYSDGGTSPSIVFTLPLGTRWSGNLDEAIDAAKEIQP